ncbi:uncharacterized protein METZ01_LOCUS389347, partial [marine metagenome]
QKNPNSIATCFDNTTLRNRIKIDKATFPFKERLQTTSNDDKFKSPQSTLEKMGHGKIL